MRHIARNLLTFSAVAAFGFASFNSLGQPPTGPPGQPVTARDVRCSYPDHGGMHGLELWLTCGVNDKLQQGGPPAL